MEGRAEIFKIISRRMPFDKLIDPEIFAQFTEGFTGAELTSVCQNSALRAIERDLDARTVHLSGRIFTSVLIFSDFI